MIEQNRRRQHINIQKYASNGRFERSFPANTGGIVMIFYSGMRYDTLEAEEECRKIERGTDGRQNPVDTGFSGREAEYEKE
jgi:hypothetical protein